jgi:hypothetical protein
MFIRKDNEGKRYFFPYGKFGKGYFIEGDEKYKEAEIVMTGMWLLLVASFVLGIDPVNWEINFIFPLVFIPTLFLIPLAVIFKLKKASIEWGETTGYTKPNSPKTRKEIMIGLMFGIFFLFVLVTWFLYRNQKSQSIYEVFFIGYVLYAIYKLLKRLWSGIIRIK